MHVCGAASAVVGDDLEDIFPYENPVCEPLVVAGGEYGGRDWSLQRCEELVGSGCETRR